MTNEPAAILAKLKISMWVPRLSDRAVTGEIHSMKRAGPKAGQYQKNLIDPKAMTGVVAAQTELRATHHELTRPWEEDGRRLLPMALMPEYETRMASGKILFDEEANKFLEVYPDLKSSAVLELGDMWREEDYPSPEALARKFGVDYYFEPIPSGAAIPMSAPDREALAARVEKDAQARLAESARGVSIRLRDTLQGVHDRLSSYGDKLDAGERTRFRVNILDEITNLAGLLPALNIEQDMFLNGIAERLSEGLAKERADLLRDDSLKRNAALKEMEAILARMEEQDEAEN